jgi:hypothetical protein
LRRFFYTGPDGSFPCGDGRFVALNGPTFRFLVAPAYLVEEFAPVIAMIVHSQVAFDQIGDPFRCPQLRPIPVSHGPFGQEANEACLLFRGQTWGSA